MALKRSPLFSTGPTESMSVSRTSFVVAQFCTLKKSLFSFDVSEVKCFLFYLPLLILHQVPDESKFNALKE